MTWIALFDESGTNGQSPLIYMGCVLARGDQWKGFNADWKQVLDDYGVPYAHGSEMLHRKGPYKDWDSGRVNEFGFKLEKLYHKHLYAGAVALMRKDDYDAQYAALIPSKMRRNTQLGVLFRAFLSFVPSFIREQLAEDEAIDFVYESGAPNKGDLESVYAEIKAEFSAIPEWSKRLGTLTFGGKGIPGLQAADLIVYGASRVEKVEHGELHSVIEQTSLVSPNKNAVDEIPHLRIPITQEVLGELKESLLLRFSQKRLSA